MNSYLEKQKNDSIGKKMKGLETMEEKIFKDREHWNAFTSVITSMKCADVYHVSLAYVLTLDKITRSHFNDLFDLSEDCIKFEGLLKSWQTGTSKKVTRLAFNLWNNFCYDGDSYTDKDGYETDLPSMFYGVGEIFDCSYAPYFWEAVKLRFPECVDGD